ncbi:hypothetical protein DV872_20440 [Oceanispirochaeta sp. M1]|nr:hypothetical protein DV872_20440 [Oceanispirochaeta sp. M1]
MADVLIFCHNNFMIDSDNLSRNFISSGLMNLLRIILGIVIIYYIVERSLFSWNKEIPSIYFFTIQSNLILAIYWILSPLVRKKSHPVFSLVVTTNMVITGSIFIMLIDEGFTDKLYLMLENKIISSMVHYISMASSIITHYMMPALALLDFLVFVDLGTLKPGRKIFVLIYPICYFIFHLIYSSLSGNFIYPFFDPDFVGGNVLVVLLTLGMVAAVFLIGIGLVALNRLVQGRISHYFKKLLQN